MTAYIIRRLLYAVPIVLGVVLITFVLFFVVNTPENMARRTLGPKATPEAVASWVRAHGYDLPLFYNARADGLRRVTATLLYQKCARVLVFDLGRSDATDRDIASEIRRRMGPSLAIAAPTFLLGLTVYISTALIIAFCRGTYLDRWGTVACVLMMSISSLFYIIGGQFVFARWLRLFPISGFDWGGSTAKFVFLPVVIGVVAGIGGSVRFYRTVMLEEVSRDYVRTARAKGLPERVVIFRHVLRNIAIPLVTVIGSDLGNLLGGAMITETVFSFNGIGRLAVEAVINRWYDAVMGVTLLWAVVFVGVNLAIDVAYALVDPRVTFEEDR